MKCFVFGTAGFGKSTVTTLPGEIKEYLHRLVNDNIDILVGDCQGIDTLIQQELKNLNYTKVTVYHSGNKARNNIGGWLTCAVAVPKGVKGRDFYTYKDVAMCRACGYGIAIWDGESKGTGRNISDLKQQNKIIYTWRLDKNEWDTYK